MKPHIEIQELLQLRDDQVLTLSNILDAQWFEWQEPRHIEKARATFTEKGWRHNSLKEVAQKTTVAKMMEILSEFGPLRIESKGSLWLVDYQYDHQAKRIHRTSNTAELCDGLWDTVRLIGVNNLICIPSTEPSVIP